MTAERKPHLYLSGPMTGRPDLNFPTFFMAAARLRVLGYRVTNPPELPVLNLSTWGDCLRVDIKALMDCEAICMLPGWQDSKGARLEHHNAVELGMQVFHIEQLLGTASDVVMAPTAPYAMATDLWVSTAEINRLAEECKAGQSFAVRPGGNESYLRADMACNAWAFDAVLRWRKEASAAVKAKSVPLPRVDLLLSDHELVALHRVQAPEQSITYRQSQHGPVLCATSGHNSWAFDVIESMRANPLQVAA